MKRKEKKTYLKHNYATGYPLLSLIWLHLRAVDYDRRRVFSQESTTATPLPPLEFLKALVLLNDDDTVSLKPTVAFYKSLLIKF